MNSSKKMEEAKKYLSAGDKCLKTSLLKWNPDYDGAASEYTKAATALKGIKAYEDAKKAFILAANAQKSNKSYYHAAKSLESAGMMCKELGNLDEAASLIEKAAYMHRENGTVDTAAITLERAAKMIEGKSPDRAVALYENAADVVETEDRHGQAAEMIGKAARCLIRLNRLEEAVSRLNREMSFYCEAQNSSSIAKSLAGLVLIHLTQSDVVAANKALSQASGLPGVSSTDEYPVLVQLVAAFDQDDMELASQLAWSPALKYLDNAFSRLAKLLSQKAASSAARGDFTTTSAAAPSATGPVEDDEFEEGGLC